jgi:uncharacterized repeat protein (TIGR01451 family)
MKRSAAVVLAVSAVLLLPSLASAAETCATAGPDVCVDVAHTPDSVSAAAPGSLTYAQFTTVVRNRGASTVTHVRLIDRLPAGTELTSLAVSRGSCTTAADTVACELGRLATGEQATLALSVRIPTDTGQIANSVTASFDERTNDGPTADPKQDTVNATDPIAVTSEEGAVVSWIPAGVAADLTTDPSGAGVATAGQPVVANVHVPAQPTGRVASLARIGGAFICPRKEVCRGGDWMEATVPGTFTDAPLEFGLRWDVSLLARKQSIRNLAVFHTACLDGCPVETITQRCSSGTPAAFEQPCLWAVKEEQDGDFSAVLIRDHNGYMR